MTYSDDYELLEPWRAGDRQAGDALVERHFETVYRFLRSKVTSDIEDMVQQTFLACVEGRDRFRHEASFRTYLFAIARFQLYAYYRRARAQLDFTTTSVRDLAASPTGVLIEQQDQRLLLEAMQRIPLDMQITLELAYWEELSGPDIALVLGVPENTVYSRMRRARHQLKCVMEQLGTPPELARRALRESRGKQ